MIKFSHDKLGLVCDRPVLLGVRINMFYDKVMIRYYCTRHNRTRACYISPESELDSVMINTPPVISPQPQLSREAVRMAAG